MDLREVQELSANPIAVVGIHRSGTSSLGRVLDRHKSLKSLTKSRNPKDGSTTVSPDQSVRPGVKRKLELSAIRLLPFQASCRATHRRTMALPFHGRKATSNSRRDCLRSHGAASTEGPLGKRERVVVEITFASLLDPLLFVEGAEC